MHQWASPAVKESAAMERAPRTAPAHSDGAAARKWDDAAFDCRSDGRVIEYGEPRAHGLWPRRAQGARTQTDRWPPTRKHDLGGRKGAARSFCESRWSRRNVKHPRSQGGLRKGYRARNQQQHDL